MPGGIYYCFITSYLWRKEMPKMKSNSGAKKRFRLTGRSKKNGGGKVVRNQACKRHGMIKRPQDMIRSSRGTTVAADADVVIVKRLLPYLKKFGKKK
jgi:large subunit ribosomal protein L35